VGFVMCIIGFVFAQLLEYEHLLNELTQLTH